VASSDLAGGDGTIEMLDGSTLEVDVDSSPATIGEAPISQTDLEAGNGIVHVIDAPIAGAVSTISERLDADGRFTTLLAALEAAGLGEAVDNGDVTVLAPVDAAFDGLPEGVLDQLLADPGRLETLLTHHVVAGAVEGPGTFTTAFGDEVVVGDADVDGVSMATPDVGAGVVPLEGVLLPDGFVLADVNDILDLAPITFEVGSATITADGQTELDRAVEYLTANPVAVEIGGHTDSDGADEANQILSEQRAQAVVAYLVSGGVDANLLTAVGYGEAEPIAPNDTDEGKAQNRRIEFSILG
jgi:outer membrane protein OmpA-like peptidoglycan-associated protein/uncharacterized surface protein with fasciclin (FAS1) repeats